jgi:CRISPR-associated protein Cmr5
MSDQTTLRVEVPMSDAPTMAPVLTRQQRMAQSAFTHVSRRGPGIPKEYRSFALSFPSLIQAAGLCQAVAFAQAKGGKNKDVLDDVVATLTESNSYQGSFEEDVRQKGVGEYLRLTRLTLQAATWVKRYVEALNKATPEAPQN